MKRSNKVIVQLICAARPNFMKVAPLYHALKVEPWAKIVIVHTGQHYDLNMADMIFNDLGLPRPDIHLGVGSGTHAEQTGKVMIEYEKILMKNMPDLVVVVGDVNSTMASAIAAKKLHGMVAHLEAGLRSFDRDMPEEINRVVTDSIADILWTTSEDANENLRREGITEEKIFYVGNIMIDSLELVRKKIEKLEVRKEFGLEKNCYGVVTLHRPSNVDDEEKLKLLCEKLIQISEDISLVFPVHPRTRKNLEKMGLIKKIEKYQKLQLPGPMSYIRFMNLVFNCSIVITDSGGIQEETTYLGIPCLTLRSNTERPITIKQGTNQLCGVNDLEERVEKRIKEKIGKIRPIKFWDGNTAARVVQCIRRKYIS